MRIFRNRIFLKSLSIFFILEIVFNVGWPTFSYALTAGPTAPEATSFEPVDTTDMVNIASGDLAYNIPLLEIPGPSGGYPLSLSYHAGIQPNEEASWVGLGWTLNPGAITRNVNGFADDHQDIENSTRFYWKGGERETYSVGISIGAGGLAGVSAGLSFSQDTYQGSGIGASIGYGFDLFKGSKSTLGLGASVGISPYGDPYASLGLQGGLSPNGTEEGASLTGSIGLSTNFKSVDGNASVGVSYRGSREGKDSKGNIVDKPFTSSVLGASISTGSKGHIGVSIVGSSGFSNSRSGVVSTSSTGFNMSIPVIPIAGLWVSIGYNKQRYFIDQIDKVNINGSLYYPTTSVTKSWLNENTFDTYSLMDQDSLVEVTDPEKSWGGAMPNFDNYSVSAQGVGGSIRPYYFQKHLIKQNDFQIKEDGDGDEYKSYSIVQYQTGYDSKKAEFRFIGDFSNRFEYDHGAIKRYPLSGHTIKDSPLSYDFAWGGNPVIGESGADSYVTNKIYGSRNVEWFTNAEIINGTAKASGFINSEASGFNRAALSPNAIGGFSITNESGVTYHFALPAMSYSEYSYSENREDALKFNEFKNPAPYAYTWYLTAVTGPDYIDRGPSGSGDGLVNEYDWGYWVEFEYGKWTDIYNWRNPSEGFHKDLDTKFKNFSEGRKELYYLDAIRTKTHTALFVKDIRLDAKSTVYSLRNISNLTLFPVGERGRTAKETITSVTKNGGFAPQFISNTCNRLYFDSNSDYNDRGSISYYSRPTSSLKLSEVVLIKNEDVNHLGGVDKSNGLEFAQHYQYNWNVEKNQNFPQKVDQCNFSALIFNHHLYQNVLDVYDSKLDSIRLAALRIIKLDTDYSLSPETINSFDFNEINKANPTATIDSLTRESHGKLTLKKLYFKGKGGADLLPPTIFNYDVNNPIFGSVSFAKSSNNNPKDYFFSFTNSGLTPGDIIVIINNGKKCYGVIREINSGIHQVRIVGKHLPDVNQICSWITTKNPPYNKDLYDAWGLYKSDLDQTLLNVSEDAARLVSSVSSRGVDAWSLRSIKSPAGASIEIEYESDSYNKPVLAEAQLLRVDNVKQKSGNQNYEITLYDDVPDLDKIILENSLLECDLLFGDPYFKLGSGEQFESRVESLSLQVQAISKVSSRWVIEVNSLSSYFQTRPNSGGKIFLPPIILAGNVGYTAAHDNLGGGLRVKSISVASLSHTKQTLYHYNKIGYQYSSGSTSYLPGGFDQVVYKFPESGSLKDYFAKSDLRKKAKEKYAKIHHRSFSKILANARELPPPGVIYEFVTVQGKLVKDGIQTTGDNYTTYNFHVFKDGMVGIIYKDEDRLGFSKPLNAIYDGKLPPYDSIKLRKTILKNYSAVVGNLKSVTLYDNNANKVNETINHYLHDALLVQDLPSNDPTVPDSLEIYLKLYEVKLASKFNNQGVMEESFSNARFVKQKYEVPVNYDGFPFLMNKKAFHLLGVLSKREEYPSIQLGQTTVNYKSGLRTSTQNLAFDFYSGQVIKTLSTDGYGNHYVSESIPAYRIYPTMGVAAKGGYNMLTQEAASHSYKVEPLDINHKLGLISSGVQTWTNEADILGHPELYATALLQSIGTKNTKGYYPATTAGLTNNLLPGDRIKFTQAGIERIAKIVSAEKKVNLNRWDYELQIVTGAGITTSLSNVTVQRITVSRKHSTYSFIGNETTSLRSDGLYPISNNQLPEFNAWDKGQVPSIEWQKNGEITLYDVYSHALEANDLNNQYAATKMSSDQTQVLATIANARYTEFAYSGAEDKAINGYFGGNVKQEAATSSTKAHTGLLSVKVPSANEPAFRFETEAGGKQLNVSVWCDKNDGKIVYKVNGGVPQVAILNPIKQAGSWYLLNAILPLIPPNSSIEIWCEATTSETYFDDFRVHPLNSAMVSYVYNKWGELSHVLDNNNLYTEYRYDGMGRLTETYKESFQNSYGNQGIVKVSEIKYNYGALNPYNVTITPLVSGSTGKLDKTSPVVIAQGGETVFEVQKDGNCSYPILSFVQVDGKQLNFNTQGKAILPDGTEVYRAGYFYTFKKVATSHTFRAVFHSYAGQGYAYCYSDANGCYDGSFEYYYLDQCGAQGTKYRVTDINSVPENLRQYLPSNGCPVTTGSNCNQFPQTEQ
jgi:hypothetical protein